MPVHLKLGPMITCSGLYMIHTLPKVLESVLWIASAHSHNTAAMSSFGATMTVVVIVFSPSHVWQHCGNFYVDSCPKGSHCSHCCIIQVIYTPRYVNIGWIPLERPLTWDLRCISVSKSLVLMYLGLISFGDDVSTPWNLLKDCIFLPRGRKPEQRDFTAPSLEPTKPSDKKSTREHTDTRQAHHTAANDNIFPIHTNYPAPYLNSVQ